MSRLLSTGSCGLFHTGSINGAFKTGEQTTDWQLKKVLTALHQLWTTCQLDEMITLMSQEVDDSLFHFVAHGGLKMD